MTTDDLVPRIHAAIEQAEQDARTDIDHFDDVPQLEDPRDRYIVKLAHASFRRCAADRALIADVTAWKHAECEDGWYSCSQAPDWNDSTPGAGCANEDRAGRPCDCGRDDRVNTVLTHLADSYGVAATVEVR